MRNNKKSTDGEKFLKVSLRKGGSERDAEENLHKKQKDRRLKREIDDESKSIK